MKKMNLSFALVTLAVTVSVLIVEADASHEDKKHLSERKLLKTFNSALLSKKNAGDGGISRLAENLKIAKRSCVSSTPTPCGWSDWSDWTECNTGCDAGLRKRNRTCLCESGGCEGESTQWEECPLDGCFPEAVSGCGTRVIKGAMHRIVGGETAAEGAWPWQAQLLLKSTNGKVLCGGTLVGPRYVISAAHCFGRIDYSDPRNVKVFLGKRNLTLSLEGGEGEIAVKKVIVHKRYDDTTFDNDIAMIILAEDQSPSDQINFACLDVDHAKLFDNSSDCFTTGWGLTAWEGNVASQLQEANVPLIDRVTCNENSYGGLVTENMLCAGFMAGGIAACMGDSGGPLVCSAKDSNCDVLRWYLVGVTSWTAIPCASPNYPVVYVDVSKYTSWIQDHMKCN